MNSTRTICPRVLLFIGLGMRRHTLTLDSSDIEHIGLAAGRAACALPGLPPAH
ncbi:hypothetical protein [Wenjunlia tyrosinilytica]|jgi:hypothetical protein|uniref:Uncharacterized protein n=1 Tax=Wenjunlia tyrosinilytica TaxID=1544741 RepID=A0A918E209_9ACTN|nr:hypothetical protein [Wenjunlia tyrosinilytica]GGP01049.1 hypothetical protein GCM10012280_71110 [Wenjunlia tyrosinilytica]